MSGVVHLHRKVAGSLNLGFLPTYLVFFFFFGGGLLISSVGSTSFLLINKFALDTKQSICLVMSFLYITISIFASSNLLNFPCITP